MAPRTLLRFLATMSPSKTLSSSTDFLGAQLYGFPAPSISRRDEEGFSSCLACPCHRAVALTPPGWFAASASCDAPCCLRSPVESSARWESTFEATSAFTFVTAQWLAVIPRMIWSIGFKDSVSFLLAIQATGLLTFTPVGLTSH